MRENDPLRLKYIQYPNSRKQAALRDAIPCKDGYCSLLPALSELRAQLQIEGDVFSRSESLPSTGLLDLSLRMRWALDLVTEVVTCNSLLLQRDER